MSSELRDYLNVPAPEAARLLLGAELHRQVGNQTVIVKIVETEAYSADDEASHSYRGQTPRTAIMFGPAGFLYVYFTYGMHHCCNIVTGADGDGSAVLIRAVETVVGEDILARQRQPYTGAAITNGPGKLCQALQITRADNGHDLTKLPTVLKINPPLAAIDIVETTRIGIRKAVDKPWRFYIKDSKYVSKSVTNITNLKK